MADSSIFTQEEKRKILNELRALEERKQVILSSQHQRDKELFNNETEEKKRVKDIIEFKQVQKKYRIQLKNSYKETWDDDIELNNIQKEIDDLIANSKELLLDIYKGYNSSADLKPYLNEIDK